MAFFINDQTFKNWMPSTGCTYETIDESGEIVVELLKKHKMKHEQQSLT